MTVHFGVARRRSRGAGQARARGRLRGGAPRAL